MRSFLLGCLKHYLMDDWKSRNTQKAGGEVNKLCFDEQLNSECPVNDDDQFSLDFDREWAKSILRRVFDRLKSVAEADGKIELYKILRTQLTGNDEVNLEGVARRTGREPGSVRVALHRFRQRFRAYLREEVQQTLLPGEDLEQELQYLARVFTAEKQEGPDEQRR